MTRSDLIASVAVVISLASAVISAAVYRLGRKAEARETTTALVNEWWGEEMSSLRRFYRAEADRRLLEYRQRGEDPSFREVEQRWPEDAGRLRKLCFFFDRVGWLGAAGLVDVDYVLAAFQGWVIEVWAAISPLVEKERVPTNGNPVFLSGFEWLDKRSRSGRDQARLIRRKFRHPRLLTAQDEQIWRDRIGASARAVTDARGGQLSD